MTRAETREKLTAWLAGELSPEALWYWASAQIEALKTGSDGAEDELVRDVLDVLSGLPFDLILPEDGEIMLYGLSNPADEADLAQNLLWNHLDGVDTDARRTALKDDPFYGPYCGDVI